MEVTIYRDQDLTEVEEVLVSDAKGHAKSKDLYYGTYYVRETKAPKGYQLYDHTFEVMIGNELTVDGKKVDTPPKEMELLYHLASSPNRVFTRNQLLDEVWGFDYFGDSRTVDVHIKRLREKLEGVSEQWCLKTVWGVGYKFEVETGA